MTFSRRLQFSASGAVDTITPDGAYAARRAADFIDSMGVVAHLAAARYSDIQEVKTSLNYLGFAHIRTNLSQDSMLSARNTLIAAGITMSYTTLKPAGGTAPTDTQIQTAVDNRLADINNNTDASANGYINSTDSAEPFNEYDNSGDANWDSTLRTAQARLFSQGRAIFGTALPILGPALVGNSLQNTTPVLGDLSTQIDYGNLHSYYGGKQPESAFPDCPPNTTPDFRAIGAPPTNSLTFDNRLTLVATNVSKTKPMIITEAGYHNDPTSTTHKYTSLTAAGIYMPRVYLEAFRIGVARTYTYELLDEPGVSPTYEQHFGFFDMNSNAKPAADAMHVLTSLLADTGVTRADFTPGQLNFSVAGATNATANLRRVLLQKSDGSFWLALWQGVSVFDVGPSGVPGTDTNPEPMTVTVTLGSSATVTAYYDNSMTPTDLGNHMSFDIPIGAKVTILRIVA